MPSVLLTVFFVQLAIYIVNSLGAAAVSELVRIAQRPPHYSHR